MFDLSLLVFFLFVLFVYLCSSSFILGIFSLFFQFVVLLFYLFILPLCHISCSDVSLFLDLLLLSLSSFSQCLFLFKFVFSCLSDILFITFLFLLFVFTLLFFLIFFSDLTDLLMPVSIFILV